VPDTGGFAFGTPLVVLAALLVGAGGFACVRRVVREP
jgi:L-lactate permease